MQLVKSLGPRRSTIDVIVLVPAGEVVSAEQMVRFVDDGGNFGWKVIFLDNKEPGIKKTSYRGKVLPGYYSPIKNEQGMDDPAYDRYYQIRIYID